MPEVSRFYGIIIRMFYRDHGPPHFHAQYGEQEALIAIKSLEVLAGYLSPRARGLVVEWAFLHQDELLANWKRATAFERPRRIDPLP
jgi:hypothetical protein